MRVVGKILANLHGLAAQRVRHLGGSGPVQYLRQPLLPSHSLGPVAVAFFGWWLGVAAVPQVLQFGLFTRGALFQEKDVGYHVSARITLECRSRQSDRSQQFGLECQRFAGRCVLRVHQVARYHHGLQPTGLQGIHASQEKLIVNALAVVLWVVLHAQADRAKGRIANVQVKGVIRQRHLLKGGMHDVRLRVQRASNAGGNAVQFNAGQECASPDVFWHQANEVAGPYRRLQRHAATKPQALGRAPHEAGHCLAGVVGVGSGG